MSSVENSLSQSQQYYLQSMGVDLYATREKIAAESEKTAPVKARPAPLPEKTMFKVALSELTDTRLIADICCLLKIKPEDIKPAGDASFALGPLQWAFNEQGEDISIKQNRLESGQLSTLQTVKAKSVLWARLHSVLTKA